MEPKDRDNIKAKIEQLLSEHAEEFADSRIRLYNVDWGYEENCVDTSHVLAKFYLGKNGNGKFSKYLQDVGKLVAVIGESGFDAWLVEWKNDCPDDISDLVLGLRDSDNRG